MISKIWNGRISGVPALLVGFVRVFFGRFADRFSTMIHTRNLASCGDGVTIQHSCAIRHCGSIHLSDRVYIGRRVELSAEIPGLLYVGKNTQINKSCHIDFSGGLTIGESCTLSEGVMIQTHDHGYDPRSKPVPKALIIGDRVWVGARAVILQNVGTIGNNSIIAAGSVVTKAVPEGVMVGGNPAKILKNLMTIE